MTTVSVGLGGHDGGFETFADAVELVRQCRPVWDAIGRSDRDLVRQLRRASTSVGLNLAEAGHRTGGHRRERLETAYGSCREVKAILVIAEAAGYVPRSRIERPWRLADSVCARLFRMTRSR